MPATKKTEQFADEFVQAKEYATNLLYVEETDNFYLYNEAEGYYQCFETKDFDELLYRHFKYKFARSLSLSAIKDIAYNIKMSCYQRVKKMTSSFIALEDSLISTDTFELSDFDRLSYCSHKVRVSSEQLSTPIPLFQKFLDFIIVDQLYEPDKELQQVIQEMFGYYLIPNLKAQAVFFLVGDGANGKSKMLEVLMEIIGRQFISALNIEALTTNRFAAAALVGKRLNVCTEEESKYLRGDKFKALVTGDPIQVDRKYQDSFVFTPTAKYLFLTNEMPSFDTINHGLRRRMKIVPFHRTITDAERDPDIVEKLKAELPGIVGWALAGAQKLVQKNYQFTEAAAMKATLQDFEDNTSSALMFFRESYEPFPDGFISNTDLYQHYTFWCEENGRKKMNSNNFGKDLGKMLKLKTKVAWDASVKGNVRGRMIRKKTTV